MLTAPSVRPTLPSLKPQRKYRLRGKELELARSLGSEGGRKNTPEQRRARKLTMYRLLAKKHPTSVRVAAKIRELEREAGNGAE